MNPQNPTVIDQSREIATTGNDRDHVIDVQGHATGDLDRAIDARDRAIGHGVEIETTKDDEIVVAIAAQETINGPVEEVDHVMLRNRETGSRVAIEVATETRAETV